MAENPTVKLGVLISGTGSNLQAIIDAILRGDLKAEIRLVISNRPDAQGLERARRPGIHGPKDALEYGVKIAGCTVFFVTPGVDVGPVIVQAAVPVLPGDDEQRLAARILQQEHRIFPHAISLYQQGRLEIEGRRVIIKGDSSTPNSSPLVNPPVD